MTLFGRFLDIQEGILATDEEVVAGDD